MFYQIDGVSREQVGGFLLSSQPCASCGSPIGLCYSSTSEQEVCCEGCTYSLILAGPAYPTRSNACAGASIGNSYYFNGSASTPEVNNFMYTNEAGTILLSEGYYKFSGTKVLNVNSGGMVTEILIC